MFHIWVYSDWVCTDGGLLYSAMTVACYTVLLAMCVTCYMLLVETWQAHWSKITQNVRVLLMKVGC